MASSPFGGIGCRAWGGAVLPIGKAGQVGFHLGHLGTSDHGCFRRSVCVKNIDAHTYTHTETHRRKYTRTHTHTRALEGTPQQQDTKTAANTSSICTLTAGYGMYTRCFNRSEGLQRLSHHLPGFPLAIRASPTCLWQCFVGSNAPVRSELILQMSSSTCAESAFTLPPCGRPL